VSRYRFIAQERTSYPVRQLCAVLGVPASGFYDWLKRQPSRREQANAALSQREVNSPIVRIARAPYTGKNASR
jgi:hypothetical protein